MAKGIILNLVQDAQKPSREDETPWTVWNNTMISSNREENC